MLTSIFSLLGRLHTFRILYFTDILRMFSRDIPRNTEHPLYTFRISCKFRVLSIPQKNKPQNPLTSHVNANPGAKCEKQKKGCKMWKSDAKYLAIHFLFFAFCDCFHIFRNKCIADLTVPITHQQRWYIWPWVEASMWLVVWNTTKKANTSQWICQRWETV